MSLYHKSGYLNVPWLEQEADKNGVSIIIVIGSRQIGKTYGTLELMLDGDKRFILMRRTQIECDFLCNKTLNPFISLGRDDIEIRHDTKLTGSIVRVEDESLEQIGLTVSLKGVSKIRGFSGQLYTDLVYDEFIPESHVMRIKNEGDAFINALITISGNRELEGRKPLRTWLLANSNNIASPILEALNVSKKIEQMAAKGQEYSLLKDRGIIIVLAAASGVTNKRKKTSILKAIGSEDSEVVKMAFDNSFSYNDSENVTHKDLKQYQLICSIDGILSLWKKKGGSGLYVSSFVKSNRMFTNNKRGQVEFLKSFPDLKIYYFSNRIEFQSLLIKEKFKSLIKIE